MPYKLIDWRRVARALPGLPVWAFAVAVFAFSFATQADGGHDWQHFFGPAARDWLHPGRLGVPLLPWSALLLSPLGALPDRLASALVNGASVIALALVVRRLGGPDWLAVTVLTTPFGLWLFRSGQVDALILLGLLFSNGLDPLLLALKPQIGAGVMLARLRRAGPRYLAPLAVALALSFLVWPGWPLLALRLGGDVVGGNWNWSLFPWSVPVGAFALWRAWRTGDEGWGLMAMPLLSPYVNASTWIGLLAAVAVRWTKLYLCVWLLNGAALVWVFTTALAAGPLFAAGAVLSAALLLAGFLGLAATARQLWRPRLPRGKPVNARLTTE